MQCTPLRVFIHIILNRDIGRIPAIFHFPTGNGTVIQIRLLCILNIKSSTRRTCIISVCSGNGNLCLAAFRRYRCIVCIGYRIVRTGHKIPVAVIYGDSRLDFLSGIIIYTRCIIIKREHRRIQCHRRNLSSLLLRNPVLIICLGSLYIEIQRTGICYGRHGGRPCYFIICAVIDFVI